jgi:peroxiredoxin
VTGGSTSGPSLPPVAGKIGVTLLCVYLLAVTVRISGCYGADTRVRDQAPDVGPKVGAEFPRFALRDLSGASVTRDDLLGKPAILVLVPSLDWSPPTKARVLELVRALGGRRDVRVAVVMTEAQATPRSLAFVRDRRTPFYYLTDGGDLLASMGLVGSAPDGSPAALPATCVLDANGVVRLRDVRPDPRTWPAPELLLPAASY